jgi:HD-like signal output (HDOD) protein/CheY-like chemotaxis protein
MAASKILVVERNPKIGGLIAGQLKEKGYDALDVRHGAEAALSLRQRPADLILMDSQVPMGGIKTARILRLHPKYQAIPIVMGLPTEKDKAREHIVQGQQHGLEHYLMKPFTLAALQKKIDEVLKLDQPAQKPTFLQIREEIRSLTELPAMPEAHSKLLMLLSKPDNEVDMNQVARTLEMDPALSARVMRTCRSAYFGFQGNLMKQALAFLGISEIRKIVQSAVIYNVFEEEKEGGESRLTMSDLWKHSLATGMVMELIGKADKKKTHFLLGVLHDIGKAIFKIRFQEHFTSVLDLVEKENISILRAEQELLGITHADCGGELAVHWDLPGEVRTAIAAHHSPAQTTQHRRLAAMVHVADIAVRTMQIGFAGDGLIPEMDPYAKRSFPKKVEEIAAQKEDLVQQVEAMLGEGGEG